MKSVWWSRAALTLILVSGLLTSVGPALADDDDGKLKIEMRGLRCYDGPGETWYHQLASYTASEPTTLQAGYAVVGRERGSQTDSTLQAGTFQQAIPYVFYFQSSNARRFRWLKVALAGVESEHAGTDQASDEADCDPLDSGQGVEVTLSVICGRDPSGLKAFAIADIANHSNQITPMSGSLELLGRRGGDFQELTSNTINYHLHPHTVEFETIQGIDDGLRRVRLEVDLTVGTGQTVRERAEADCPG